MALNTFKCNCLTPLHFKGLKYWTEMSKSKSRFALSRIESLMVI